MNTWTDGEEAVFFALLDGYGLASVLDKMAARCETHAINERDDGTEADAEKWDRAMGILDRAKIAFEPEFDADERAYILEQAKSEWCSDELEVYQDSRITRSDDDGAWIEAKVFVRLEICTNPDCKAIEGTAKWGTVGDGGDGYCPSCADKRGEQS